MNTHKKVQISYHDGETVTVKSKNIASWICKCEYVHPILEGSIHNGSISQINCPFCARKYLARQNKNKKGILIELTECD